jgi:WD40 repeat protein
LATTPDRYSVKVWDINRRALAFKFWTAFTDSINTLAYSPDGKILATGSYEGNITFWDMTTGVRLNTIPTDAAITSLAFSPDGQVLATGSGFQDNLIRLWSAASGELLRELDGNTQAVTQLLFSPDSQFIVSGSYNGDVILWGIRP